MDLPKIPMLNRFDAISHIMPYFDETHRAFLLLSSLCSKTRNKLNEFYDEFISCMSEYCMHVRVDSKDLHAKLFLPNDMFKVSLNLCDKEMIDSFIKFIKNLRGFKGRYFKSHYMHSNIKIQDPVRVGFDSINKIFAYIDLLKSIQVILYKEDIQTSKVKYESSTLDILKKIHTKHMS